MTQTIDALENATNLGPTSRRAFLTRGAVGAAGAVAGAAVLNALMASPAAAVAGNTVMLTTPQRIWDTRPGQPTPAGLGEGGAVPLVYTGSATGRKIWFGTDSPAVDVIPDDATAAIINIAITSTVSTGALAISRGDAGAAPATAIINWFGSNQIISNAAVVPTIQTAPGGKNNLNISSIKVWIVAGTTNVSSTHFIIDVMGYVAGS